MNSCLACGLALTKRNKLYCSNLCQRDFEYQEYIKKWKNGLADGNRGVNTKNISGHILRYLRRKYRACTLCGWAQKHPITGRAPLEIDHIDGNSENNLEENLRLICPNCHSLTENFRNLNKGKGRGWRKLKYVKNIT